MATNGEAKPLRMMAEAFNGLAITLIFKNKVHMEVDSFSHACSVVSPLFRCLRMAFKFAEIDYVAKVDDLVEASRSIENLLAMMDKDMEADCVKKVGSHTRNVLRVKRGIYMFKQILASEGNSLKDLASKAYAEGWAIRKAVGAIPTKS